MKYRLLAPLILACVLAAPSFAADNHDVKGLYLLSDYPAVEAWVRRVEAELPIRDPR